MTVTAATGEPGTQTLMRSGTAARLAGLSPSTLRIWEHRYGVVAPPKSAAGQRTYSMKDIERLRLIKRLTLEGHAIGTVAHLDIAALLALSSVHSVPAEGVQRVLVIGHTVARRLEGWLRPAPAIVFDDLSHAEREVALAGAADVLVIHLPSLHASMVERLMALHSSLPVPNVIVVYSFGPEVVADALCAAGFSVRREPVAGKALASLILAARPTPAAVGIQTEANLRRYSDAELVAMTEIPSTVACECPRHLAEIVTLLVGFERYSAECVGLNQNDAALHRHLYEVTGAARTMLEQALVRLMISEGLTLATRP